MALILVEKKEINLHAYMNLIEIEWDIMPMKFDFAILFTNIYSSMHFG